MGIYSVCVFLEKRVHRVVSGEGTEKNVAGKVPLGPLRRARRAGGVRVGVSEDGEIGRQHRGLGPAGCAAGRAALTVAQTPAPGMASGLPIRQQGAGTLGVAGDCPMALRQPDAAGRGGVHAAPLPLSSTPRRSCQRSGCRCVRGRPLVEPRAASAAWPVLHCRVLCHLPHTLLVPHVGAPPHRPSDAAAAFRPLTTWSPPTPAGGRECGRQLSSLCRPRSL